MGQTSPRRIIRIAAFYLLSLAVTGLVCWLLAIILPVHLSPGGGLK